MKIWSSRSEVNEHSGCKDNTFFPLSSVCIHEQIWNGLNFMKLTKCIKILNLNVPWKKFPEIIWDVCLKIQHNLSIVRMSSAKSHSVDPRPTLEPAPMRRFQKEEKSTQRGGTRRGRSSSAPTSAGCRWSGRSGERACGHLEGGGSVKIE